MKGAGSRALTAVCALIYGFILGPILITAAVSFNASNRSYFPPRGFSLQWWASLVDGRWEGPLQFSLMLASIVAVVTTAIGTPLAFALHRYAFRGRGVVRALAVGPLVLPSIVTGIALLQFLTLLGLVDWIGFPALLIGHVIICLPFNLRTVLVGLAAMPTNLEPAAASLGAPPASVLRHVTLPLIAPGAGAGLVFAFINSFDDVNLSLFVSSPAQRPLTVQIIGFLEFGFSPTLAALSILSMMIPLALVALFGRFIGIGNFIHQEHGHG